MTEVIIDQENQTCEIITDRPDHVEMTLNEIYSVMPLKKPMRIYTDCNKLTIINKEI